MIKYADPTAAEILAMYQENHFHSSPSSSTIPSELTIAGLETLTQTHPKLRKVVKSKLAKGRDLVIDEDTVWKYPIAQHSALYSKYASWATSIVINGVYEFDLDPLLRLFPNITGLTLRNVQMDLRTVHRMSVIACPLKLRRFRVIDSKLNLGNWYEQMESLEELHFEGTDSVNLPDLTRLSQLTLLVPEVKSWSTTTCPLLKRLTINHCWNGLKEEQIKGFTKLQHLKVMRSVDWKVKEQIKGMHLKSADVHYMEIPTEANLILRLNMDCLMHLQRYLSSEDWMTFRESHPMFQQLPIRQYKIDVQSLKRLPVATNQQYYKRIGPLVTSLYVRDLDYYALLPLIHFFTNLRDLDVDHWFDLGPVSGVRKLSVTTYKLAFLATAMMKSLRTSVESLDLMIRIDDDGGVQSVNGLEELQNVKEFKINELLVTREALTFLHTNQRHMRKLEIWELFGNQKSLEEFWLIIADMPNLQELYIQMSCSKEMTKIPQLPTGCLPRLEKLSLLLGDVKGKGYEQLLKSLDCSQLKSVWFEGTGLEFDVDISGRMTSLEVLNIKGSLLGELQIPIDAIIALTQLKKCSVVLEDQQVLPLVQGLPHLRTLNTLRNLELKAIQETRKYLKEVNRKLCINGIDY